MRSKDRDLRRNLIYSPLDKRQIDARRAKNKAARHARRRARMLSGG